MSFNYNHTILVGRLTRDAEVKDVSNSIRTSFTIAVNRPYRKEDGVYDTDFVPIVAWGRLGEIASQYLKKGNPVLIEGRIQVRQYTKDSVDHWMTEIVAENFQLLGNGSNKSKEQEPEKELKKKEK